jgi:hypothetical protein
MNKALEYRSSFYQELLSLFSKEQIFSFFFHEFATIFEKSLNYILDYKKNS